MEIIGLKELREKTDEIMERVRRGESLVVVKRSKPVFMLSPVTEQEQWQEVIDFTKVKRGGVKIDDLLSRL